MVVAVKGPGWLQQRGWGQGGCGEKGGGQGGSHSFTLNAVPQGHDRHVCCRELSLGGCMGGALSAWSVFTIALSVGFALKKR